MKICGIIAEYNPFHLGHKHHFDMTRAILGQDTAIICVQSGNFVQRGEPALLDKYRRAQMAVQAGADLVLEMPLGAALSSAEDFARGGISVLQAISNVGFLSFGSECGTARKIIEAAQLLDTPAVQHEVQNAMKAGVSYAAALQTALEAYDLSLASLMAAPNDSLGVAYCRAMAQTTITPLAIMRRGAGHDSVKALDGIASASFLRQLVRMNQLAACRAYMPESAFTVLHQAAQDKAVPARLMDKMLVSHLRRLSAEDFARYVRAEEGFHNRLYHAVRDGKNFQDICMQAQTRRYSLARIHRALIRAYLDLPLTAPVDAQYLRVLAIGRHGRALLRAAPERLPIIVRPVHEKQLPEAVQPALRQDALADELYALMLPSACSLSGGEHYRRHPYCVPRHKN